MPTEFLVAIVAGLAAGALHVVSGPDHLAAVAPLAVEERRRPWFLGLCWGVGHSGGVWILALIAWVARESIIAHIDTLSVWSERLVGFVLIAIGLWGLRRALAVRVHAHEHVHADGTKHIHIHAHDENIQHPHPVDHSHAHSALGIGTLHGLAGTSHLLGVLPSLLLPTRLAAAGYVISYGAGSIAAMTAFAWLMGIVSASSGRLGDRAHRALALTSGVAAIAIGAFWIFNAFQAAPEAVH